MKILILALSVGLFFTFAANSVVAQTQQTPDAVIKELYRLHNKNAGQILNNKNLLNRFFDANLSRLIRKDMAKPEVGVLDFDMFYDTQDPQIKNLLIGQAKIQGAKAIVPVSFTNDRTKYTVTYQLVKQNNVWKISDIKYKHGTLLGYFKEGA
jgi:ABC-type transporter MlaC component